MQRVDRAAVTVGGTNISSIQQGLIAFVGVEKGDTTRDADYLVDKIINLRIFEDSDGKMNLSLLDKNWEFMVISQFTLLGDCRKGRRPSFYKAEEPINAKKIYDYFVVKSKEKIHKVGTGEFQAMMKIDLLNDGPVTLLLDSKTGF
ncbi:MAG: D-aminoacyl-tRNA deacylase [Syntrophales bacterium]|nr:D-aminoacyl-tRNA deacylase [Syntrophales bacterium]MCK9392730.1 D-aminoacyl-tRNA deacylase [Syntrophales bacterium]